jgi:hypothetical protein
MTEIKNLNGYVALSYEELEKFMEDAYEKGYAKAKEEYTAKKTVTKSKAKITTHDGDVEEYRAAVVTEHAEKSK